MKMPQSNSNNHLRERLLQRRRINLMMLPLFGAVCLLEVRLGYVQLYKGKEITKIEDKAHVHEVPLPARRGTVYDRFHRPLAITVKQATLGFDPSLMLLEQNQATLKRYNKDFADLKKKVAGIAGIDPTQITDIVNLAKKEAEGKIVNGKYTGRRFYAIQSGLSYKQGVDIKNIVCPCGFGIHDDSTRQYSNGPYLTQVVGMMNASHVPTAGLEYSCNKWLTGTPGSIKCALDKNGMPIAETVVSNIPAKDGCDIATTIDPEIQKFTMVRAAQIFDKYHPKGVSIVVVDPNTGDILALASIPTVSPAAETLNTANIQLRDPRLIERCASMIYEPGSTLKALTIAAALDRGFITMDQRFLCNGKLEVANKWIHCPIYGNWDRYGHGYINARQILERSCNVCAARIGILMRPDNLFAADRQFGLLDKLNVHLPLSARPRLGGNKAQQRGDTIVSRVAFGHSITTTPLQVAMGYAALANGGNLMEPRLIMDVTGSDGKSVLKSTPRVVQRAVSEKTSAQMTDMLSDVITEGTGKPAAIQGYRIAGKTGTAKKYKPGKYAASFAGYLPASPNVKPRAVILVVVDEPQTGPHYGATVAAPAFREIAAFLMKHWNVPHDDPGNTQYNAAKAGLKHDHDAPHSEVHARHTI